MLGNNFNNFRAGSDLDVQIYTNGTTVTIEDGDMLSKEETIFWDDLQFPASGINPTGAPAAATINQDTGLLQFANAAENLIAIQVQMPHKWKVGSEIHPHVHWSRATQGVGNVTWQIKSNFANIGGTFAALPTTGTNSTIARGDNQGALVHNLTSLPAIDMTGMGISAMGLLTIHRLGGDPADTYTGIANMLQFDIHYQIDSEGSEEMFTKY